MYFSWKALPILQLGSHALSTVKRSTGTKCSSYYLYASMWSVPLQGNAVYGA